MYMCTYVCMCEQFWSSSHQIISMAYLYVASFPSLTACLHDVVVDGSRMQKEEINLTLHLQYLTITRIIKSPM